MNTIAFVTLFCFTMSLCAQDKNPRDVDSLANNFPCLKNPKMRQFDFWVGEWDVFLTTDPSQKVGFNKITILPGGCSLLESWESAGTPHVGQSINFYDPNNGKWHQLWVGSDGTGKHIQNFYDGVFDGNAMRFKYDAFDNNGKPTNGRFTFTIIDDNTVTQHKEISVDGGKSWTTVYNFTYKKRVIR